MDWNEALLGLRTPAERERVAERVNGWVDGCAKKGFDAVEPHNHDSCTRSHRLLTPADATAFMTLLSRHAHARALPSRSVREGVRRPGGGHRVHRRRVALGARPSGRPAGHRPAGGGRVHSGKRGVRTEGGVAGRRIGTPR
ncbi:endo alpha-1,4 polygalactosaminidase [Streptomyces sp. NPDC001093]|uniref:endo alpha-1,4 polygalactosaminidase n=1 Tax=Streptomyces sp. NPDC001093 TaxID=3154376 RepID=UPI00333319F2